MTEWMVGSGLLILVTLLLRAVSGKRISAGMRYAMWLAVLVRLLVPVSLSILPAAARLPSWTPPEVLREESIYVLPVDVAQADESNVQWTGDGAFMDPNSFGYPRLSGDGERVVRYADKISPLELLGWLWAAGSAALGGVLITSNLRFFRRLRRVRKPLEGTFAPVPVYTAAGLPSPCLMGLFRPAVYVTEEAAADPAMLRHVLAHELTHCNHLDHVWSVLRGAALAVHWWNPLVWLAVVCSRRDGELACDEGALKRLGDGERTAYGETLLALVTAKSKPGDLFRFATTMTGEKRNLTERIRRIANQPKRLAGVMAAVAAVLALASVAAFGQAKEADEPKEPDAPYSYSVSEEDPLSYAPDLDHDGMPDRLALRQGDEALGQWELQFTASGNSTPTWTDEAASPHAGWRAFFLCRRDGEDYLLRYEPWSGGGSFYYNYKLFYLDEEGNEVAVQENEVNFDINFGEEESHSFDSKAIADFMDEVNSLLADSTTLVLNTDPNLAETFQREGRLYDSLNWLEGHRMEGQSLLENLEAYAQYASDHPDDIESPLADLLLELREEDIRMFDGDESELVRCLKAAERGSRFYTWDSEAEAYIGNGAGEADYSILYLSLADGSNLWLFACEEKPSVLMILETSEEAVSAFYTAPELKEFILEICSGAD